MLNPRRAQSGQAMTVDGALPAEEFLDAQTIAFTGIFQRKKTAPDRGTHWTILMKIAGEANSE